MRTKLRDIGKCHFGLYAKPRGNGGAIYLQAKHFSDWGLQSERIDAYISLNEKNKSHLLEDGDVLLAGKGLRNFAWAYDSKLGPALASSIFFVIKVNRRKVLPEFLSTLFNSPQAQEHFQTLGAGSSVPSIRKSELLDFTFDLPDLKDQEKVIQLKNLHIRDIKLSQRIIEVKQVLYESALNEFLTKSR